ncbi:hypothetical protein CUZ56_01380 [Saezia sanguinis]|uniref:Uncharacterized protein n=2 Tax=Saezia sanguinis TaxID=1965230 RepID=A0A433SFC5_9BURK|nr:hypothetical protein CUZ56_01380 [Saezia sanguinis]
MPEYKQGFEQAVRFTRRCGFPIEAPVWNNSVQIVELGDFIDPVMRASGELIDLRACAGQCLKWCHYLRPAFEEQLGLRVWVTLGQLWKEEHIVYGPSFTDCRRWVREGVNLSDLNSSMGLNLHVWLTVETGEIIELTLLSSLAAFAHESYKKMAGGVLIGLEEKNFAGHRYFPILVGDKAMESIAEKSSIPLLASNVDELYSVGAMMMVEPL